MRSTVILQRDVLKPALFARANLLQPRLLCMDEVGKRRRIYARTSPDGKCGARSRSQRFFQSSSRLLSSAHSCHFVGGGPMSGLILDPSRHHHDATEGRSRMPWRLLSRDSKRTT